MRLGGTAAWLVEVTSVSEAKEALSWAKDHSLPAIVIGKGSNIVWGDKGYKGLVIVNKINGFEIIPTGNETANVRIAAGENWDDVVQRTVELGYDGLAELSLIPGTAGATPVQNVGAYGLEISEIFESLDAIDSKSLELVTFTKDQCNFRYRTSRFKTEDHGRYLITHITLHLEKKLPQPPYYEAVQNYFDEHNITHPTVEQMRYSVIAIRQSKLPDPAKVANNGSFFKNPITSQEHLNQISARYRNIVSWPMKDGKAKLSAAWLVEQAGFKNFHDASTGMATWPNQALVIINEKAESTEALLEFKQKIVDAVHAKFGVMLEQEPEFIEK